VVQLASFGNRIATGGCVARHPATAFPAAHAALLLIDVINPFQFPGGPRYAGRWLPAARKIARLRDRFRRARLPIVYVNDNFGQWRSDFKAIVAMCGADDMPGASIVNLLAPGPEDFFVLKPTLSGFHETALHMLLRSGDVRTLVLAGFAADICVFFTAADAHMREYRVIVPGDCVASEDDAERRRALKSMRRLFRATTTPLARLRLPRKPIIKRSS
jgi:nicotinamidase-related amidase